VPFTIIERAGDGGQQPYGEILPGNPLNYCASDISDYGKSGEVSLELYLATYGRLNTAHYSLQAFVLNGSAKYILHREMLRAPDVQDNSYRSFVFKPMSVIPGRLCFTLETSDAAPGDAITVWLNGQSNPVYRISASAPLSQVLNRMAVRNIFGLGRDTLFGIFFVCMTAQIWLVIYLAVAAYELQKTPKPAHRKRTG